MATTNKKTAAVAGEGAKAVYYKALDFDAGGGRAKKVRVRAINLVSGDVDVVTFGGAEGLREWMQAHGFGLKVFKSRREWREERECILRLYEAYAADAREDVIDEHTCLATFEHGGMPYVALDVSLPFPGDATKRCIVYRNAECDLRSPAFVAKELAASPRAVFRAVVRTTVRFLEFLHGHDMFYADWKCRNVFFSDAVAVGSPTRIIVGDYGSVRYMRGRAHARQPRISKFTYTFRPPCSGDDEDAAAFVEFWTAGKGSRFTFLKHLPPPCARLFERRSLAATARAWGRAFSSSSSSSSAPTVHDSVPLARAADWFALGVMLIELLAYLHARGGAGGRIDAAISAAYDTFCRSPVVTAAAPAGGALRPLLSL